MTQHLPRCFLDISIGGVSAGRLVVELFADEVPQTAENFRCLCTGERGKAAKVPGRLLCYRGSPFHRVIKDFMIQGGDFINHNGTGGESIYNGGGAFADESFARKHDEPYLLSCANSGKDSNRSQFFVTSRPVGHLDGKHVVFGRVVSGFDVFRKIENVPTDSKDSPLDPVMISNCGELVKKAAPAASSILVATKRERSASPSSSSSDSDSSSSSSSSSSDSESDKKKRKKRTKKTSKNSSKSKKSKRATSSSSSSDGSDSEVETRTKKATDPAPAQNSEHKFLDRDFRPARFSASTVPDKRRESHEEHQQRLIRKRQEEVRTDAAGRVVKGRGSLTFGRGSEKIMKIIVIGGGTFGLSASVSLASRGHSVTVFDRLPIPADDSSSNDITKVIRPDYGNDSMFMGGQGYQQLAIDAIAAFRELDKVAWERYRKKLYYECGVAFATQKRDMNPYEWASYQALLRTSEYKDALVRLDKSQTEKLLGKEFAHQLPHGYLNKLAGFADSGLTIVHYANLAKEAGMPVIHFKIPDAMKSKYQPSNFPVWFADMSQTGYYGFPLTPSSELKFALHAAGYSSTFHTDTKGSAKVTPKQIPRESVLAYRRFLDVYFPELNQLDISRTRLCWYCDAWDGNFYLDAVPGRKGLFVATGGSGHAFKVIDEFLSLFVAPSILTVIQFTPVLGDISADLIEGKPNKYLNMFKWRVPTQSDLARVESLKMEYEKGPKVLENMVMCDTDDLKADAFRSGRLEKKMDMRKAKI
ncbi:hypothetical protein HDU98_011263 [Podochytrium sp. JEL0797]|nr:hypothetical protein HDU98_011263 [Podochytrium sp. JEL0797]